MPGINSRSAGIKKGQVETRRDLEIGELGQRPPAAGALSPGRIGFGIAGIRGIGGIWAAPVSLPYRRDRNQKPGMAKSRTTPNFSLFLSGARRGHDRSSGRRKRSRSPTITEAAHFSIAAERVFCDEKPDGVLARGVSAGGGRQERKNEGGLQRAGRPGAGDMIGAHRHRADSADRSPVEPRCQPLPCERRGRSGRGNRPHQPGGWLWRRNGIRRNVAWGQ